tara:strand:- start:699 stop:959 length:261 start_codon:yes stop_codon:yes gene_type:complete
MLLKVLFFELLVSMICLIVGALLAPSAINKEKLEQSGYSSNKYIYNLPEFFMYSWYSKEKVFVWKLIITGFVGSLVGFSLLYFFIE